MDWRQVAENLVSPRRAMAEMEKVYILDRYASARQHWLAWKNAYSRPVQVVDDFDLDWRPPADAGIVVSVQHFRAPEVSILRRIAAEQRVPVLIQADGILEYRNTWERPDNPPGTIYQPVLGHKIACIGRSQARVLEAWGNDGKCESVGIPRLDASNRDDRRPRGGDVWRVLVATAKCPAFTAEQRCLVVSSLTYLKNWVEAQDRIDGRKVAVQWRLTDGLENEIALPVNLRLSAKIDLMAQLSEVDAVVTTPSTLMLEAMWYGIPTAVLDYTNSPGYVPAAWSITAAAHFDRVMNELANPPDAKRRLQEMLLHDSLECRGSAVGRMIRLIDEMVHCGRRCRERGQPLQLPYRIIHDESSDHASTAVAPFFDAENAVAMQLEIEHLKKLVRCQAAELTSLRRRASESLPRKVARWIFGAPRSP
jgi:hypothetical protein